MSKTKAKNAQVWARDEFDWYVEPPRATEQLLGVERFLGDCHDPCCGGGNIVKAMIAAGYRCTGSDLVQRVPDRTPWFMGERGFLLDAPYHAQNIIMNPPFFKAAGAEAFIRRALSLARGKVCAFVDIRFIAGTARAGGLFADHPPHRIWIVTPRVSCPPGAYLEAGGKAGNGSSDWVWLVWDQASPATGTQTGWLRAAS